MESKSLLVPDLHTLCDIGQAFEKYQSYCLAMSEYITSSGKAEDCSVPIYILKKFAYSQTEIASIKNNEMQNFVSAIADTACLLATMSWSSGEVPDVDITKPTKIFDDDTLASLDQSIEKLRKIIGDHMESIEVLQQIQKKCWYLDDKVENKKARLEKIKLKNEAMLKSGIPKKMATKYNKLREDMFDKQDDLVENQIVYCEMTESEAEVRSRMLQVSKDINEYLRLRIEDHINISVQNLREVIEYIHRTSETRLNGRRVLDTLNNLNITDIANHVVEQSSWTYSYPDANAYVIYLKETPKLPSGKINETIRKNYDSNVKVCKKSGGLHFSKNLKGFRLKISGRNNGTDPLPGFFDLSSDLTVKCKMGLLQGTVGFGWTRKSLYSREKSWGFFVRPPTLADTSLVNHVSDLALNRD